MSFTRNTLKDLATWFISRREDTVIQGLVTPNADGTLDLGSEAARFKKIWCVESSCGGAGAVSPFVFVPTLGGNINGFFGIPHQEQRNFGGGPYRSFTDGWDHFGIGFPFPADGEEGHVGDDAYTTVAQGIWSVPSGVTGFKVTPIYRWERRSGTADSVLETINEVMDVSLRENGEWQDGWYLYGRIDSDDDGTIPWTSTNHLWSDTSSLMMDFTEGADGPYAFVFDALPAGLQILFQSNIHDNDGDPGWGWIIGWMLELSGPGVSDGTVSGCAKDPQFVRSISGYNETDDVYVPPYFDLHGPSLQDSKTIVAQAQMVTPKGWTGDIRVTPIIHRTVSTLSKFLYAEAKVTRSKVDVTELLSDEDIGPVQIDMNSNDPGLKQLTDLQQTFTVSVRELLTLSVRRFGGDALDTYDSSVWLQGWLVEYL